jgi:dipeptidyl aminopeptidase/acylaminoacyl peptidase
MGWQTMERVFYGNDEEQFFDVSVNDDSSNKWIILIHGGYWRQKHSKENVNALFEKLSTEGFNVLTIEYRRGEHGWPIPNEDVHAAITKFKQTNFYDGKQELILIGHSVGGQLTLLNEAEVDRVVALAPVTDVPFTYDKELGQNAAKEYFGDDKALMQQASPIEKSNLTAPTLIVHGNNDDRVLVENTYDFACKFKSANLDLFIFNDLPHMECVNPTHPVFPYLMEWIRE